MQMQMQRYSCYWQATGSLSACRKRFDLA